MRRVYVDSSAWIAVLFAEPPGRGVAAALRRFDELYSSDLLIAETLAAASRERVAPESVLPSLGGVSLILPQRSLEPELRLALGEGPLRGADLWHVACALYLASGSEGELAFLSRDGAQRAVAKRLGFPTP